MNTAAPFCQISQVRNAFGLLASALLMTLANGTLFGAGKVADFKQPEQVQAWAFDNGGEYPGARGEIVHTIIKGTPAAELRYDFRPPAEPIENFNPAYVQAILPLSEAQTADAARVHLKIQVSSETIHPRIRIKDHTGQTCQYALLGRFPFTAKDDTGWLDVEVDLAHPIEFWGGPKDGVLHPPLQEMAVLIDAPGHRDSGYLRYTEVEFLPSKAPLTVALNQLSLHAPAETLGTLAERECVNIHFTNDRRALNTIQNLGFTWVRTDADWEDIEHVPGKYDFTAFDSLVSAAALRKLHVLAILDYGNSHITGGRMNPPRSKEQLEAFAKFCRAIAEHYRASDVAFEVWNEPNVDTFWGGTPNVEEFATLVRTGIDAIKSANPDARVISAGLSAPYDVTYGYWELLEKHGSLRGATGLGAHLYGTDTPEVRWTDLLRLKGFADRSISPQAGVWVTEWGFASTNFTPEKNGHDDTARKLQAVSDVRSMLVGWWANIPVNTLYEFQDGGDDPKDQEANFGLYQHDNFEKPAGAAVRQLFSAANAHAFAGIMLNPNLPDDVHVVRLDGAKGKTYIVWVEETAPVTTLRIPSGVIRVADMYGKRLKPENNELALTAATGPIYVDVEN